MLLFLRISISADIIENVKNIPVVDCCSTPFCAFPTLLPELFQVWLIKGNHWVVGMGLFTVDMCSCSQTVIIRALIGI